LTLKLIDSIALSDEIVFRLLGDWFQDSRKWLLVVDNADCYKDFYGPYPSKSSEPTLLADYLPCPEPHCKRVLFTSRDIDLGSKLSDTNSVVVQRLSDVDSSNLLRKRIARSRRRQKPAGTDHQFSEIDVQALLVTLDYLPLEGNESIKNYTSKLRESDETLISYLEQPGTPLRPNCSTPRSVVHTWLHSFTLILSKNTEAAHLLCLMACMERNAIHAKYLPPWNQDKTSMSWDHDWHSSSDDDAEFEDPDSSCSSDMNAGSEQRDHIQFPRSEAGRTTALSDLEALSMIGRQGDGGIFSIHRFVQILTIHWLKAKQTDLRVDERLSHSFYTFQQAISYFLLSQITFDQRVFMTDEDFQTTSELLPHAEWLLLHLEAPPSGTLTIKKRLLDKLSRFYLIRGDFHASKEACQTLLDITKGRDFGVKITMAGALSLLGEFDAAHEVFEGLVVSPYIEEQTFTLPDTMAVTLLLDARKNAAVVRTARGILKHIKTYDPNNVDPDALAIVNASLAACLLWNGANPENPEVQVCINTSFALLQDTEDSVCWYIAERIFAQALAAACRYDDAELIARQAIEHVRETCGSFHTETVTCEVILIVVLYQRECDRSDGFLSLDRIQEVVKMSQRLCPLDVLESNPRLCRSLIMQLAINVHADLLMLLYIALLSDVSDVIERYESNNTDDTYQITLRDDLKLLTQRQKDLSCTYNDTISYYLMAVEGSSRIYGETSYTTNRVSLFLCMMYFFGESTSGVEQHLCDRSQKTVAAIQGGMRVDTALWPRVFELYSSPVFQKANLDCYASVLLASIRADGPNLQSNAEIGKMYLSLLRQAEDKAMLLNVWENYKKDLLMRHTAICDSCDQVGIPSATYDSPSC
jgi:hypothetical protein